MARLTIVFGLLLIALGVAGYVGSGSQHPTALIPAWFGVALGLFGALAISPNEKRRMLMMHIAVTVGLLGFIGGLVEAIRGYGKPEPAGMDASGFLISAETSKELLAALMLIYVLLCVRSFINARRTRAL
jgi:hypothetical protein